MYILTSIIQYPVLRLKYLKRSDGLSIVKYLGLRHIFTRVRSVESFVKREN